MKAILGSKGGIIFASLGRRVQSSILDHKDLPLGWPETVSSCSPCVWGESMVTVSRCCWQREGVLCRVGRDQALLLSVP